MSTQHTPGPWLLETHHRQGINRLVPVWYIAAENRVGIAVQPSYSSPEHEEANARLIAAAPELLEALEALAKFHISGGHEGNADEAISMATAAIAKARGEA